jgi:hypothetical protein
VRARPRYVIQTILQHGPAKDEAAALDAVAALEKRQIIRK